MCDELDHKSAQIYCKRYHNCTMDTLEVIQFIMVYTSRVIHTNNASVQDKWQSLRDNDTLISMILLGMEEFASRAAGFNLCILCI